MMSRMTEAQLDEVLRVRRRAIEASLVQQRLRPVCAPRVPLAISPLTRMLATCREGEGGGWRMPAVDAAMDRVWSWVVVALCTCVVVALAYAWEADMRAADAAAQRAAQEATR
jgi:hypothetical protein